MKMYQALEKILKYRITSNAEIPSFLRRLSSYGKLDAPKHQAILTELIMRIVALEEKEERLPEETDPLRALPDTPPTVDTQPHELTWVEIRAKARALGVYDSKLKKAELLARISAQ